MCEVTEEALGAVPHLSAVATFPDSDTEVPDTGLVGARMRHRSPCHTWKASETQIYSPLEIFHYINYLDILESSNQGFFLLVCDIINEMCIYCGSLQVWLTGF